MIRFLASLLDSMPTWFRAYIAVHLFVQGVVYLVNDFCILVIYFLKP